MRPGKSENPVILLKVVGSLYRAFTLLGNDRRRGAAARPPTKPASGGKRQGATAVYDFLWGVVRFACASLTIGAALSYCHVGPTELLSSVGLTPDQALDLARQGAAWALPNILLGSAVLLPVWLVLFMFRPPRARG